MPFYFRKSVTAGPFRFNLSSGGVGVSIGVKGLRIGTGPGQTVTNQASIGTTSMLAGVASTTARR